MSDGASIFAGLHRPGDVAPASPSLSSPPTASLHRACRSIPRSIFPSYERGNKENPAVIQFSCLDQRSVNRPPLAGVDYRGLVWDAGLRIRMIICGVLRIAHQNRRAGMKQPFGAAASFLQKKGVRISFKRRNSSCFVSFFQSECWKC